ncbi:hypothetical protein F7R13_01880 [Burkholderia territorii]|uniref:Uncharacterized protein n=1 Tax=Burkholderia territorii TaxID=1503055 RepID=A0A6L3NNJ8_9BURK|nr:hypothetical protein F7R13_01880 [Burkholderia territorii]TXG13475.1 hypothetical protein FU139_17430 [Burkholderia territorii]
MQLAIFTISNKIDSISPHSENSPDHFRDKHAKFFLVYVCAAGFIAFSNFHLPLSESSGCPSMRRHGEQAQLVYD